MKEKSEKVMAIVKNLHSEISDLIGDSHDLDLERLLKQIEADLMDIEHKIALVIKLVSKE